jgi:hypothetical protein
VLFKECPVAIQIYVYQREPFHCYKLFNGLFFENCHMPIRNFNEYNFSIIHIIKDSLKNGLKKYNSNITRSNFYIDA